MMRRMSGADRSNARAGNSCAAAAGAPVEEVEEVTPDAAAEEFALAAVLAAGVGSEVDADVATGAGEGG